MVKRDKKWIVCALVLALLLFAVACGQTEANGGGDGMLENENGTDAGIQDEALVDFYLGVIKDLYEEDSALNDGVEVIAVDLSNVTNLSEEEKEALLEKVAGEYSVETKAATYEELVSEGAILNPDEFPEFEKGLLFSFDDFEAEGDTIKFTIGKWRTALGAYFFTDCEAVKGENGNWTYTQGAFAIS